MKVQYGIELQGIYDGVAVWVLPDGTYKNRFEGEGSVREAMVNDWLERGETVDE